MPNFYLAEGDVDEAQIDLFFFHGLGGDGLGTWRAQGQTDPWPSWLVQDDSRIAVWFVDYDSSPVRAKRSMNIGDRTVSLLSSLKGRVGDRPFVLVGHSLGGLLIKMMVEHCDSRRDDLLSVMDRLRGVVFMATPHTGSRLSDIATKLFPYLATELVGDLAVNLPSLADLSARYRDCVTDLRLPHLTFFETRDTKVAGRVVSAASSDPGVPFFTPVPVDADHLAICKLRDRDTDVYHRIFDFVQERLAEPSVPDSLRRLESLRTPSSGQGIDSGGSSVSAPRPRFEFHEVSVGMLGLSRATGEQGLTEYVRRDHDVKLGDLIKEAHDGTSVMAVLVSDSTSGKTRSCYESLQGLSDEWKDIAHIVRLFENSRGATPRWSSDRSVVRRY